ncbi:hypothetical protein [Pseudoramibacter porci]|uniref:Uncharacterized protein n=1 Tax=Pseudoramibacter porci TaxID=2606631 RepID=A0A7X2NEY5_9FIRM|nr:hypothetical protein [Pseudoramibacter porci]MSS19275.1 hypothetical protein [Pseudoramibacter porci]
MILVMFLDPKNGMAFNHRRQTRDSAVIDRLRQLFPGKCFWGTLKTEALFDGQEGVTFRADTDFLKKAGKGEIAVAEFASSEALLDVDASIERLIIYRWDKVYPADLICTYPLAPKGWNLTAQQVFAGTSHDTITEEVYTR